MMDISFELIFIFYPSRRFENIGGAEVFYDISSISIFEAYGISFTKVDVTFYWLL